MPRSFALFALLLAWPRLSFAQHSPAETAVRAVVLAFQADFNNGRFPRAASYTTADWQHVNPGGGLTKGREQVLAEVRAVRQGFLMGVSMPVECLTVRFVPLKLPLPTRFTVSTPTPCPAASSTSTSGRGKPTAWCGGAAGGCSPTTTTPSSAQPRPGA